MSPEALQAAIDIVHAHSNILWTLVAACQVFWMQAGCAFVESVFTRAKIAALIMMRNMLDMSMGSLSIQAVGSVVAFAWTFGVAFVLFKVIDRLVGLRVSRDEVPQGLNIGEHGSSTYLDYVVTAS